MTRRFRVLVDGKPPLADHGADTEGGGVSGTSPALSTRIALRHWPSAMMWLCTLLIVFSVAPFGAMSNAVDAALETGGGVATGWTSSDHTLEVWVDETRPLLQGARLTAWELVAAGIPVTVVADTAAGAAMAGGLVDAVLVGCDRVAANGDTANKVGTYSLAVLAAANRIPFYVVGPLSSFDPEAADGAGIEIEQRPADEVATLAGARVAPEAAAVWNPAFDVTPAALITAFVTDAGVLRPPFEASIAGALAR